jgi:electron transfer flavoprotein alpha subunit
MSGAVWTIAEFHEGAPRAVSFELLARGRSLADALGAELVSVALGDSIPDAAARDLVAGGADAVLAAEHPGLAHFVCERHAAVLASLIAERKPCIILAAATTSGRTLMPYLAVKAHAGLTADCTELAIEPGTDNLLQTRPAIGGNIMATIKTPNHRPQMATVRPKSCLPLARDPARTGRIERIRADADGFAWGAGSAGGARMLGYRRDAAGFANLEEADVVVAGGRGLKKADNMALIAGLAEDLGAEIGASREAVDRGWVGYPHQIGLSGKTISPKLYLGIGISGSIQHLAGIKTSELIVSINSDPEANLNKIADFAVVGDLFEIVPALRKRLARGRRA